MAGLVRKADWPIGRDRRDDFGMTVLQIIVAISLTFAWGCLWTCFSILIGCKISYRAMRREDPTKFMGDNGVGVTTMRENKPKEEQKRFDV